MRKIRSYATDQLWGLYSNIWSTPHWCSFVRDCVEEKKNELVNRISDPSKIQALNYRIDLAPMKYATTNDFMLQDLYNRINRLISVEQYNEMSQNDSLIHAPYSTRLQENKITAYAIGELQDFLSSHSLDNRTLHKAISPSTPTVTLMDQFSSTKEISNYYSHYNYDYLIDEYGFYVPVFNSVNIVIGHGNRNFSYIGDITMTAYKHRSISSHLADFIRHELYNSPKYRKYKAGEIFLFNSPYLLRAQNSGNRTGYGTIYHYDELVHQGTLYGETTDYAIIGIQKRP